MNGRGGEKENKAQFDESPAAENVLVFQVSEIYQS